MLDIYHKLFNLIFYDLLSYDSLFPAYLYFINRLLRLVKYPCYHMLMGNYLGNYH